MSKDPYSVMSDEDHVDMCEWIDDTHGNDTMRCECEDAPCCGCYDFRVM